jgi:hypothetical protein
VFQKKKFEGYKQLRDFHPIVKASMTNNHFDVTDHQNYYTIVTVPLFLQKLCMINNALPNIIAQNNLPYYLGFLYHNPAFQVEKLVDVDTIFLCLRLARAEVNNLLNFPVNSFVLDVITRPPGTLLFEVNFGKSVVLILLASEKRLLEFSKLSKFSRMTKFE